MKLGGLVLSVTMLSVTILAGSALAAAVTSAKPTYSKDVAPILNQRCVGCHRTGEAAPMPLTSYRDVRPWAKAIREAVLVRRMPVWLADPQFGKFHNQRRLDQREIDTIVGWVDAGAPEGDARQLPPAPALLDGWNIGKPDLVVDMGTDFDVPATGVVPYKYFRAPSGFTEDKWVEAAEIRPDKRGVVHHVIVFIQEPGKNFQGGDGSTLLVGFAPGEQPMQAGSGAAKLVMAGSTFVFQMHYTPNGKPALDRSYVGLRFAKEPPKYRAVTGRALNFGFRIPPNEPSYEVRSSWTAKEDVRIAGFMPHMHLRGKDFKYTAVYPDGREQVVLSVPKYDFNWQLTYELVEPLELPKGSRLDCVAHFDNSPNNKFNPDPTKEVRWGDQTWEEMMIGWFTYLVPAQPALVAPAEAQQ